MKYLSFEFFAFVTIVLVLYYVVPMPFRQEKIRSVIRQGILLAASMTFYYLASSIRGGVLFLTTVLVSYSLGRGMERLRLYAGSAATRKLLFSAAILVCGMPLLIIKMTPWFPALNVSIRDNIIVPLGVSFYTLQIIGYVSDCYTGRIKAERNILRYALFVSYFPHIVQGPIPRYSQLSKSFAQNNKFSLRNITRGIQLVIWGCFLKMMIADRVCATVNMIFYNIDNYRGAYVIIGAILYSIQLYTDFYSCVTICQGVSEMFGISIGENFQRPYFAISIKDFWRRWHISLSSWFRDYIYIPLGGSRKGTLRKYINILVVFLVSGLWHGEGLNFIAWGLLHGIYQVIGGITFPIREHIWSGLKVDRGTLGYRLMKRTVTFFWVAIGWVFFRAKDLESAFCMLRNLFSEFNPWLIFGNERFSYGIDVHDWFLLACSLAVLLVMSAFQERGIKLRDAFERQPMPVRWSVYILAICVIWVFGAYGSGYNAIDFIYGGF